MAITNKVKVNICGTDYYLTTDEPIGLVQDAAARVDTEMRNLLNADSRMDLLKAAVLTALIHTADTGRSDASADNLRMQMKQYLDENNRLHREIEQLRQMLGRRTDNEPESMSFFEEN